MVLSKQNVILRRIGSLVLGIATVAILLLTAALLALQGLALLIEEHDTELQGIAWFFMAITALVGGAISWFFVRSANRLLGIQGKPFRAKPPSDASYIVWAIGAPRWLIIVSTLTIGTAGGLALFGLGHALEGLRGQVPGTLLLAIIIIGTIILFLTFGWLFYKANLFLRKCLRLRYPDLALIWTSKNGVTFPNIGTLPWENVSGFDTTIFFRNTFLTVGGRQLPPEFDLAKTYFTNDFWISTNITIDSPKEILAALKAEHQKYIGNGSKTI